MTISESRLATYGAILLGVTGTVSLANNARYDAAERHVMRQAAESRLSSIPEPQYMEHLGIPYVIPSVAGSDRSTLLSIEAIPNGNGTFNLIGQSCDELGFPHTTEIRNYRPKQAVAPQAARTRPSNNS